MTVENTAIEPEAEVKTEAPAVDTPSEDPILSELGETEDKSEETPADPQDSEEEVDETPEEDSTDDETPAEGEKNPEDDKESEEDAELDPKEEARRRYDERQRYIAERKAKVAAETREYVESATDETEQRLRAIEVQEYDRIIEGNENTLIGEYERVKVNPDLQMFNIDNKEEFNQKAYDKALRDYNAGYLEYDRNGNLIGIKGSLYQHLTETAELLQSAVKTGAIKQVRASRTMKNNSESKPAASPKEAKVDPILDALASD